MPECKSTQQGESRTKTCLLNHTGGTGPRLGGQQQIVCGGAARPVAALAALKQMHQPPAQRGGHQALPGNQQQVGLPAHLCQISNIFK